MTTSRVREQFGTNAKAYVASEVHAKGASLQRIVELLNPDKAWQVLDIATGAGHTAFALAPYVAHVLATDVTPEMLDQATRLAAQRGLNNITVEAADASDLPYPDSSFDLVTCRIAAHHFAVVERFIAEAVRVLKRDGRLVVVDNIVPPGAVGDYVNALELLRDPSHVRCLNLDAWTEQFERAGLKIEHQETLAKKLQFDFWAQRHNQVMQAYLRALLTECNTAVATFLSPLDTEKGLQFRLVEGLMIGRKVVAPNAADPD